MRHGLLTALAAALLLTSSLSAQAPAGFSEVVEVRVTNIDFIVTDAKGNPVEGLTKNDFEILENGKAQEISNFYEVKLRGGQSSDEAARAQESASEPVFPQSRKFILYLDNMTLAPAGRNQLLLAAKDFMRRNLRRDDQVMIATWNRSMAIRLPWTSDQAKVEETIDVLMKEGATASSLTSERRLVESQIKQMILDNKVQEAKPFPNSGPQNSYRDLVESARRYAASVHHDVQQSVNALTKLLSTLSGVEGRKMLLMASQSLPTRPGSDMFQMLEDLQNDPGGGEGPGLAKGMRRESRTTSLAGEVAKYDTSKILQNLARAANATNVTIYALNPEAEGGSSSGTVERTGPGSSGMDFAVAIAGSDGFQILANVTGGQAMIGAKAPVAFAALEKDLGAYYSIGFKSRSGEAAERSIDVRAKNPEHRVRARRSLFYKSLQVDMADHVIANHYQDQFSNTLQVSLAVGGPLREEGGRKILPLRVMVPVGKLSLLPEGNEYVGGFSVYVSSADSKGDISNVSLQKHDIRWPREAYEQLKKKSFSFASDVVIEGARNQISVGVVDHVSQETGFAKSVIPAS